MAETKNAEFDIGHPAPDRKRVGWFRVAFCLLGAPLAWSFQLNFGSAVAGILCLSPAGTVVQAESDWASVSIWAVNLAALALALLAGIIAFANMRATRHEKGAPSGGLMQAGEGRTRFLSVWGLWTSLLFLIAVSVNTIAVFWRGLCPL